MSGEIIPFPRRPLNDPPVWSDGKIQDRCDDLVHVWEEVPGRCQCGERLWTATETPDGIGIFIDPDGRAS